MKDPYAFARDVPVFTTDWRASIEHWPAMFDELGLVGKPGLAFLEVGCFEGRTTLWLLEHVLTHPSSWIAVVDPFTAAEGQRERFTENLAHYIGEGKVAVQEGRSQQVLRYWKPEPTYDFAYIDGSHLACDVLADAVLAWPLIEHGGVMCFDDYYWPDMPELHAPGIAVDAFVRCYEGQLDGERRGMDQYMVRKR